MRRFNFAKRGGSSSEWSKHDMASVLGLVKAHSAGQSALPRCGSSFCAVHYGGRAPRSPAKARRSGDQQQLGDKAAGLLPIEFRQRQLEQPLCDAVEIFGGKLQFFRYLRDQRFLLLGTV